MPGFLLILGDVLAMNLIGGNGSSQVPLKFLLLGMSLGACAIVVRSMNSKASYYAGSAPYYLAGAFGAACCICNILAYRSANIFYSTIFMLIGQVVTGIIMDICVFHILSPGRCIGITFVLAGVLLDKRLSFQKQEVRES